MRHALLELTPAKAVARWAYLRRFLREARSFGKLKKTSNHGEHRGHGEITGTPVVSRYPLHVLGTADYGGVAVESGGHSCGIRAGDCVGVVTTRIRFEADYAALIERPGQIHRRLAWTISGGAVVGREDLRAVL